MAAPNPPAPQTLLNEDGPANIHIGLNTVDQPDAHAAFVQSRGACRITANHFHSHRHVSQLPGPCVTVFSIGKPWEAVDLPVGEPSANRWAQPGGSIEYLNGRAQQLPDGDGGSLCFTGNQVTTNGATSVSGLGFGAMLISTDHISVAGNQFAGQNRPPTATLIPVPQVLTVGVTAVVTANRVAETLMSTTISLAAMAPMLIACAGNQLTHCPAVFGCANHGNPDYFLEEDNLVWFRPASGRCEEPAGRVIVLLRRLCGTFFGPTGGDIPDAFSTLRGEQP
jgi:hypothetical protein